MVEAPFSEQQITRYLLGELSEEEQVEIEDRAFEDKKVLGEIQAVEQDLIDDYVSGDIPAEKRQQFETHFLASTERRKKVAFARALSAVVNESPVPQPQPAAIKDVAGPSLLTQLTAFFTRPAMAYSFAAASLLLFVVGAWLVTDRIRLNSELAKLRTAQESQMAQNRQLEKDLADARHRNEELIANRQAPPQQAPTPEIHPENPQQPTTPTSPVTVALALLPGISRASNSIPQLSISKEVNQVRLQIGIDPQETYTKYRVELRNGKGQQVFAAGNLAAHGSRNGRTIPLSVPAGTLTNGRYEVTLKGISESGTPEDVGFYYFDVVKK